MASNSLEDFGPLTGWLQTMSRAELWALIQAATRWPAFEGVYADSATCVTG